MDVVERRVFKNWKLEVWKRRLNHARPYFIQIYDPTGSNRHVSQTQPGQRHIVFKEVTYSTIEAARSAGFVAIRRYIERKDDAAGVEEAYRALVEDIINCHGTPSIKKSLE